jgi:hypothetical protein
MKDDRLLELLREERSVVALALIMALLFVACFALIHAAPRFPAHVHEALASVPSLPPLMSPTWAADMNAHLEVAAATATGLISRRLHSSTSS